MIYYHKLVVQKLHKPWKNKQDTEANHTKILFIVKELLQHSAIQLIFFLLVIKNHQGNITQYLVNDFPFLQNNDVCQQVRITTWVLITKSQSHNLFLCFWFFLKQMRENILDIESTLWQALLYEETPAKKEVTS